MMMMIVMMLMMMNCMWVLEDAWYGPFPLYSVGWVGIWQMVNDDGIGVANC